MIILMIIMLLFAILTSTKPDWKQQMTEYEALQEARRYIAGGTPLYDFERVIKLIDEAIKNSDLEKEQAEKARKTFSTIDYFPPTNSIF